MAYPYQPQPSASAPITAYPYQPQPMAYPCQPQPSASAPPMPVLPTTIICPQYCDPYPVNLAVVKKSYIYQMSGSAPVTIADNLTITDVNDNIVFTVFTLGDHRLLVDAARNPIITLRRKILTMHDRWEAYRGQSTNAKNMIFTVKRSSLIQFKTKLDVFLAGNTKEDVCDFKVKGSWSERSCIVYAGESNNIVAQMHKKNTVTNILIDKDHFMVKVCPNVDYAFIVALIVILGEIKDGTKGSN
ncbi:putative tubby-like domain-containing protein [Medicago truncatula]|uniref:Putative tubby-like domain-containing protein n=1 Tax=Medicago truncatula TaxID=3880 RepID=G7KW26_MEDTR|nr:protein LURP-one-related 10 [Medicago truncatula]AES79762.2 tubby C 2 protein [Medicago truncatula]RHN46636.1 putative tubby-like domain-containing protein [Medicago truncatula]